MRKTLLFLAILAFAGSTLAAGAAELPSEKKAQPRETAAGQKKCNIGGVAGVVAGNGVCVRLSGSITAGFGAAQIK